MSNIVTSSITEFQDRFLKERQLSPSKLLQEKIDEVMKEQDPEMYQQNMSKYNKKGLEEAHMTKWQKLMALYPNDYYKRLFINEILFKHALGYEVYDSPLRDKINENVAKEELQEILDRLKEFEDAKNV